MLAPDALAANQRGELTDTQRKNFGALARSNHRSHLSAALFLTAGALLILFFAPPGHEPARTLLPVSGLAIAVIVAARAVSGSDALSRDLRAGRVECVEGAIGKRRVAGSGGSSMGGHFLDVGARSFNVSLRTYEAAPDAGYVRLYFMPKSRKVVNLEQLADRPVEPTRQGLFAALGAALHARGLVQRNEARAEAAGIAHAFGAMFSAAPPAAHARDPRPLAEAIVGRWSNGFLTIAFAADGNVTTQIAGGEQRGRWSIDTHGRLHADVAGQQHDADAWVAGDELTLAEGGQGMKLRRG